jgi:hypothetical protein
MNPVDHPIRVLTVLIVVVTCAFSAAALGAFHTVQGFYHGIGGPGCGPQLQNCTLTSEIYDEDGTGPNALLSAGNYHWTGSSWNQQCFSSPPYHLLFLTCNGPSGSLPCQKYSFNSGHDPQSNLAWHGHNPASICA